MSTVAASAPEGTLFNVSRSTNMMYDLVRAPDRYSGNVEKDLRDVHSIDAAVKAIYENVQRLLQDLIYLKRHRNSLGICGSLPSEILLEIFRRCPKEREAVDDQCYAFSQVCHRWRTIAIADRSLWTTPDLLRPRLAKEMYMNRASGLPLQVHVPDLWRSVVVDIPWELSEHTESIDISYSDHRSGFYYSEHPEAYVHRFLRAPRGFPILKTLALRSSDDSSEQLLDIISRAPNLRSITFENCLPLYHSPWLSNLTSLIIKLEQCPYQTSDGVAHLRKPISYVLRRSPNLEKLVLVDVMNRGQRPRLMPPALHDTEPIELMHLKTLDVKDDIGNIVRLIPLLKVPFASKVHIQADLVLGDDNDVHLEQLGRASLGFLEANQWTNKFRYMILSRNENSQIQFREQQEHGDFFQLDIPRLFHTVQPSAWSMFLASSLLTLDLYQVECWTGEGARRLPMDGVCTALSRLPSLGRLEVFDDLSEAQMIESLLAALEPHGPDASGAAQTFPALNTLDIIDIGTDEETPEPRRDSVYHRLVTIINRRREAGKNAPEITVEDYSFIEPLMTATSELNVNILQPHMMANE